MNPWHVVEQFEFELAEYTGAPYAVCVDSCTNALFLTLVKWREERGVAEVLIPKYTYVGVAQAVLNSGNRIRWTGEEWQGEYRLYPTWTIDSARRFYKGMYKNGDVCLSFHWQKHLPIGKGGAILTDDKERALAYSRMRYDGRTPGTRPAWDTFTRGYHCFMDPKDATQGLALMQYVAPFNEDLPADGYGDLSKQEIFNG